MHALIYYIYKWTMPKSSTYLPSMSKGLSINFCIENVSLSDNISIKISIYNDYTMHRVKHNTHHFSKLYKILGLDYLQD